jgi:hypothetical protein
MSKKTILNTWLIILNGGQTKTTPSVRWDERLPFLRYNSMDGWSFSSLGVLAHVIDYATIGRYTFSADGKFNNYSAVFIESNILTEFNIPVTLVDHALTKQITFANFLEKVVKSLE